MGAMSRVKVTAAGGAAGRRAQAIKVRGSPGASVSPLRKIAVLDTVDEWYSHSRSHDYSPVSDVCGCLLLPCRAAGRHERTGGSSRGRRRDARTRGARPGAAARGARRHPASHGLERLRAALTARGFRVVDGGSDARADIYVRLAIDPAIGCPE